MWRLLGRLSPGNLRVTKWLRRASDYDDKKFAEQPPAKRTLLVLADTRTPEINGDLQADPAEKALEALARTWTELASVQGSPAQTLRAGDLAQQFAVCLRSQPALLGRWVTLQTAG